MIRVAQTTIIGGPRSLARGAVVPPPGCVGCWGRGRNTILTIMGVVAAVGGVVVAVVCRRPRGLLFLAKLHGRRVRR